MSTVALYNEITKQHEPVDLDALTEEEFRRYMPQDAFTQQRFTHLLNDGDNRTPLAAWVEIKRAIRH